jgi:hypothetical protein
VCALACVQTPLFPPLSQYCIFLCFTVFCILSSFTFFMFWWSPHHTLPFSFHRLFALSSSSPHTCVVSAFVFIVSINNLLKAVIRSWGVELLGNIVPTSMLTSRLRRACVYLAMTEICVYG